MKKTLADAIVRNTPFSQEQQRELLSVASAHKALAENKRIDMPQDIWFELYKLKPKPVPVAMAAALASRELSTAQFAWVLKDARLQPITSAFMYNDFDAEAVEMILAHKNSSKLAAELLGTMNSRWSPRRDMIPKDMVSRLARQAGGYHLLDELENMDGVELREVLAQFDEWRPKRTGSRVTGPLEDLIDDDENLCAWYATSGVVSLASVAAGSLHLRSETDQHAVVNLAKSVSDPEQRRTMMFACVKLANLPAAHRSTVELIATLGDSMLKATQAAERRLAAFDKKPTVSVPYAEVTDPDVLAWLVKRATPFSGFDYSSPGKPLELCALAHNRNLPDDLARKVYHTLSDRSFAAKCGFECAEMARGALANLLGVGFEPFRYSSSTPLEGEKQIRDTTPVQALFDAGEIKRISSMTAYSLSNRLGTLPPVFDWLAATVSNGEVWRCLLGIVDENSTVSVGELVELAEVIAVT